MPARARQRPRRREPAVRIPSSMVRATAFIPIPPWATPAGTQTFGISCSSPMMPTGETGILVIGNADGEGVVLREPISVMLRDPLTLQVTCATGFTIVGAYIPYNDPGFRGITGGMLNPGELSAPAGSPRPFPWCCAIG